MNDKLEKVIKYVNNYLYALLLKKYPAFINTQELLPQGT